MQDEDYEVRQAVIGAILSLAGHGMIALRTMTIV
jgi:hypothetical protein